MNQIDTLWQQIRAQVEPMAAMEPALSGFLENSVMNQPDIARALGFILANKLASHATPASMMAAIFEDALAHNQELPDQFCCDIAAVYERDSACRQQATVLLYNKGFHALSAWRIAHWLWQENRKPLALVLQNRISVCFGVDIHPAARIGKGIMLDHATGIVIGETATVDSCVSIMQSVTLGGTGKEAGDRHPKVGRGVLIGPGAKILGNIPVGEGAMIAASSVVLTPVPPHTIFAGVPARQVGSTRVREPARQMDQGLDDCCCG